MDPDFHSDQQPIVRTVIERYFNAIDRRDYALLATCFTQDVDFEFNLETKIAVKGRDALIARMSAIPRPAASSHALSNTSIDIDADGATAVTFAVVHVILGQIDGGKVLVRGIRYDDRLVREEGHWLIAARRHNPLWQYETVATLPWVPERP
jgi:ketosteroid isomerase-like protein